MCAEAENEAEKIQAQPWWRERAIRRGDTEKGRGGDGRRLGDGEAGFPGASHTEELGWGKGRSGSQLTGMFGYPEWQACQSGTPLSLAARCSPFTAMFLSAPWHFPRCELKPSGFCALPAPPPPRQPLRPGTFKDKVWTVVGLGAEAGGQVRRVPTFPLHQKGPFNNHEGTILF